MSDTTAFPAARPGTVSRAGARLTLTLVLLGSLALNVVAVDWGLPAWRAWAFDEITPAGVHDAARAGFAYPWINNYPPFHFYVLAAVFAGVDWLQAHGAFAAGASGYHLQYLASRLLSSLLVTATAWVVYRAARVLFARGPSLLAAALQALLMPHIYYAKTANLEAAYVFWFTLSLFFFVRMLARGHRLRDYLAFTLAAVLSIGTKDQAVGLYVLVPVVTLMTLHGHRRDRGRRRGIGFALVDVRVVASVASAAVGLALVHTLWRNWEGARIHLHILTRGPVVFQAYPATLDGTLALWAQAARHLRFTLGWPWLVLAALGVVVALRAWRQNRHLLGLLCFPVSLVFVFFPLVHYHYERFFIPLGPIAALFAAGAWSWLRESARLPRAITASALTLVLGYQAAYAASVDLLLLVDSRKLTEEWLSANRAPGDRVLAVGLAVNLPRIPEPMYFNRFDRRGLEVLRTRNPRFVVFNRPEAEREGAAHQLARMASGDLNYRTVARIQGKPVLSLIDTHGVETNLDKVNPEILVFERERPWAIDPMEVARRLRSPLDACSLQDLGRMLARDGYPEKRALLVERVYTVGVTGDGWAVEGEPAVVIVTNPARASYRPRIELMGHSRAIYPLAVFLDDGCERLRFDLPSPAPLSFDLPIVPPDSDVVYRVSAERSIEPWAGDPRRLEVHLGPGLVEDLGPGFRAIDLSHDGWTGPDRPALLLLANPDPGRRATPVLHLESLAPAAAHPIRVTIDEDAGRAERVFAAPGQEEVVLAPIEPHRRSVVFVSTDKTWEPGGADPRSLGVRVEVAWSYGPGFSAGR